MRILFAGTPEFAAASLDAIFDAEHNVVGVYTQPDRPAGRGKKLMPSPVKQTALKHEIPVFQPFSLKEPDAVAELAALKPDIMIVAAYGLILPKDVLEIPEFGCINIHASLLPRWRGAAPIQRAIQAGDTETGITIMQMDVGLDTGDMLIKTTCPIDDTVTGGELHDRLSDIGAESILDYLNRREELSPKIQDESLATYAHKLTKAEARIDWNKEARELGLTVRAFNPWPVSFTEEGEQRIRILKAHVDDDTASQSNSSAPGTILSKNKDGITVNCGEGALVITRLQLAGSKAVAVADFVNGGKALLEPHTVLK